MAWPLIAAIAAKAGANIAGNIQNRQQQAAGAIANAPVPTGPTNVSPANPWAQWAAPTADGGFLSRYGGPTGFFGQANKTGGIQTPWSVMQGQQPAQVPAGPAGPAQPAPGAKPVGSTQQYALGTSPAQGMTAPPTTAQTAQPQVQMSAQQVAPQQDQQAALAGLPTQQELQSMVDSGQLSQEDYDVMVQYQTEILQNSALQGTQGEVSATGFSDTLGPGSPPTSTGDYTPYVPPPQDQWSPDAGVSAPPSGQAPGTTGPDAQPEQPAPGTGTGGTPAVEPPPETMGTADNPFDVPDPVAPGDNVQPNTSDFPSTGAGSPWVEGDEQFPDIAQNSPEAYQAMVTSPAFRALMEQFPGLQAFIPGQDAWTAERNSSLWNMLSGPFFGDPFHLPGEPTAFGAGANMLLGQSRAFEPFLDYIQQIGRQQQGKAGLASDFFGRLLGQAEGGAFDTATPEMRDALLGEALLASNEGTMAGRRGMASARASRGRQGGESDLMAAALEAGGRQAFGQSRRQIEMEMADRRQRDALTRSEFGKALLGALGGERDASTLNIGTQMQTNPFEAALIEAIMQAGGTQMAKSLGGKASTIQGIGDIIGLVGGGAKGLSSVLSLFGGSGGGGDGKE